MNSFPREHQNGSVQDLGAVIEEYLTIIWKRKWWLIVPIPLSLLVAFALMVYLPKSYLSSTLILVEPQKVPEDYVKSSISGSIEDRLATIRQQIMSRTLLQRIIDHYGLYKKEMKKLSQDEIVELMRKKIVIQTVGTHRGVDSFTISFEGDDPKTVMEVTDKLASLYISENLQVREQLVEGTTVFLEKELQTLKESLDRQEQLISSHKQQFMGGLPEQLDANLRTLDRFQLELQNITASIKFAEEKKSGLEKARSGESEVSANTAAVSPQPALTQDYLLLKRYRRELEGLRMSFTEAYPDVIILKKKVKELEIEIANKEKEEKESDSGDRPQSSPTPSGDPQIQRELRAAREELDNLNERKSSILGKIKKLEFEVEQTPVREQQLMTLMRDYDNTKRAYQSLLDKKINAQLSENLEKRQQGEQFRVIDPANYPLKPYKPNMIAVFCLSLAGGLGIGIGIILLKDSMDKSFRKPEEIKALLGIGVLASIPKFDQSTIRTVASKSDKYQTAQN
jgi:succinoglycan biosynthesis transport protein ExoP